MFRNLFFLFLLLCVGCSSYNSFKYLTEEFEYPSKVFKVDFNKTWQAVLEIMKKYDIAYQNQEAGVIKTKWIDNTSDMNFSDAFSSQDMVKGAKFKLSISVIKELRMGNEVAKVSILKRQIVEQDFLQGWKEVPTDAILEQTILYRIERILKMDFALKKLEQARDEAKKKELENSN